MVLGIATLDRLVVKDLKMEKAYGNILCNGVHRTSRTNTLPKCNKTIKIKRCLFTIGPKNQMRIRNQNTHFIQVTFIQRGFLAKCSRLMLFIMKIRPTLQRLLTVYNAWPIRGRWKCRGNGYGTWWDSRQRQRSQHFPKMIFPLIILYLNSIFDKAWLIFKECNIHTKKNFLLDWIITLIPFLTWRHTSQP